MSFGVLWPGFLPSSFSMYSVSLSSALFLLQKPAMAVSVASAGVILGWPFSILVVLPLTVYSLLSGRFKQVFLSAAATSLTILVRYNLYHFGSSDPLFIHIKGFRTWFWAWLTQRMKQLGRIFSVYIYSEIIISLVFLLQLHGLIVDMQIRSYFGFVLMYIYILCICGLF